MKRLTCALLMAAAVAQPAWADEDEAPAAASWWRPYVGVGYAWGGNTLLATKITINGTSTIYDEDISAGSGLDLRLGLRLQPTSSPIGLKVAYAYQVDGASGLNAWWAFRRHPLELGLVWSANDKLSLGLGARKSLRAKVRLHKDDYAYSSSYKAPYDEHDELESSTGFYGEAEWHLTPFVSLSARAVHESFKLKRVTVETPVGSGSADLGDSGKRYGANSFGLALTYYFR